MMLLRGGPSDGDLKKPIITDIKLSERGMIEREKLRYRKKEYSADHQLLSALE